MNIHRQTPIMGWASWNCFRTQINEESIKEQARALVDTGLAACGYEYLNMDDGFFGGRGADGKVLAHEERFPNGIKCIADYAHSLGLKAGIYADGGDMTCGFYYDNEGGNGTCVGLYHHEENDLKMYLEEYGYDFIKVDWCGGLRLGLDEREQYTKIGNIIEQIRQRTAHDIVYNVCRWQFPGEWVTAVADSWRTGADIEPEFSSILQQLDNIKPLAKYCGPGHVNDLDMMQIGNGMTPNEERTHFAMWCMMSTPLMIGCDLTKIQNSTLEILKNGELIAIDQDDACLQAYVAREIRSENGQLLGEIWIKNLHQKHSPQKAVAFLNRSERELDFHVTARELGLDGNILSVRDVHKHENLPPTEDYQITIAPHGVEVYVIMAERCGMEQEVPIDRNETEEVVAEELLTDEEVRELLGKGALLVDVRDREEYDRGHLEGAINIPYTGIHAEARKYLPDQRQSIIVYCKTGKRSSQAQRSLRYLGYTSVYKWKNEKIGEEKEYIYPGKEWLDTSGKAIQAHGGSLFYEDGCFYWYGENKERTTPDNGILQWGVRYYSSHDLYHWKDEGLLIPPDIENTESLLHPSAKAERPHIIHNRETGKYICWMKVIVDCEQLALVMEAEHFRGPYTIIRNGIKPLEMCMGDFDLVTDEAGCGYLIFEKVHTNLVCARLNREYTDVTGEYVMCDEEKCPPYTREAPAHFSYNGKHYLITSGTTGYHPNPSIGFVADHLLGEWVKLGDTHPSDSSRTSYNSQISSVFRHPLKKDLYIALADRWMPYLAQLDSEAFSDGSLYERIRHNFEVEFSGDDVQRKQLQWTIPAPDTSQSQYVWLPIRMENGCPVIEWKERWSIEDYE